MSRKSTGLSVNPPKPVKALYEDTIDEEENESKSVIEEVKVEEEKVEEKIESKPEPELDLSDNESNKSIEF